MRTIVTGSTGSPWYYNHYYQGTTPGEAVQALAASKAWVSSVAALQSNVNTAQVQGDVAYMNPVNGDVLGIYAGASASYPGGAAGTRSAPVDQVLVRLRTGVYSGGREIRGRWFLPGFTTAAFSNGTVGSTTITTLNGINNTLLSSASGAGSLAVWSRTKGTTAAVTLMNVWDQVAVQRSRRD